MTLSASSESVKEYASHVMPLAAAVPNQMEGLWTELRAAQADAIYWRQRAIYAEEELSKLRWELDDEGALEPESN